MDTGWIKISRDINKHWLWSDAEKLQWWLDLLLLAAWEEHKILHDSHLITLGKGELIASLTFLSERWKKSKHTIINYLKLLENEKMIYRKTLHRQTPIVTICNYESYQLAEGDTLHPQMHSILHPNRRKERIYKENSTYVEQKKKISFETNKSADEKNFSEKEKSLRERQAVFESEVQTFSESYDADMLADFISYWTEPNKSHSKMRFEQERTWDLKRRLDYWERRSRQYKNKNAYGTSTNGNGYIAPELRAEQERREQEKRLAARIARLAEEDGGGW